MRATTSAGLGTVIIDDAHLLDPDAVARLVDRIEDADDLRLIVAGRILPDAVHEVTQLVDGLIIDATALAVTAHEIVDHVPERSPTVATRVVEAADGCVRVIATALDQAMREPGADPIALASRMVRAANSAALQQLGPRDNAVIGLLSRAPGIDRRLLDRLAGPGFVERALAAGVPLRRLLTGGIDLAAAASFRSAPVEPMAAAHLAAELVERDRPIEAIGLLLDAGAHAEAARMVMELSESVTDTVEPRLLLGLLARLGTVTEHEPALLLLRAAATRSIGRVDDAVADIDLRGRPWPRRASRACAGGPRSRPPAPAWPRAGTRTRCAPPSRRSSISASVRSTPTPVPTRCSPSARRRPTPGPTCSAPPSATASRRRRGRDAASTPGPGPAGATSRWACSSSSAATTRRWRSSASSWRRPTCPTPNGRGRC